MYTKKSHVMRAATLALAVALVMTCAVCGSVAKYTSSTTGSDEVKVAKWEFEVDTVDIANTTAQTIVFDLFNTVQDDSAPAIGGGDDANVDDAADTNADTVQIIAPGTGGAFDLVVKNLSQVDAEYDLDLTITKSDNTIPVEFMAKVGTTTLHDWTYDINDLDFINRQLAYLDQGTDVDEETVTIFWRWAFEQPHADDAELEAKDAVDTKLGVDAQATPATIVVKADIVATQVD